MNKNPFDEHDLFVEHYPAYASPQFGAAFSAASTYQFGSAALPAPTAPLGAPQSETYGVVGSSSPVAPKTSFGGAAQTSFGAAPLAGFSAPAAAGVLRGESSAFRAGAPSGEKILLHRPTVVLLLPP